MTENARHREVPAVRRALAILRYLGRSPEPAGVNQIARALELVPSTCLHILRVLVDEGLVTFDVRSRRYSIGVGILPIARDAIQRNGFVSVIEPRLTELSLAVRGTTVATRVMDAGHMVVIALSKAQLPFQLRVDLGSTFPLLISATGRLHAAFDLLDAPEDELRTDFSALSWDDPPIFEDWMDEVDQARQRGFGVDRGNYISGVTVLAVPVFGSTGRMEYSIVAIGISEKFEAIGIETIAARMLRLRDAASSSILGAGQSD